MSSFKVELMIYKLNLTKAIFILLIIVFNNSYFRLMLGLDW